MFTFSAPRAELAKALHFVEAYKNGLVPQADQENETQCAISLLRIALAATTALNEHLLSEGKASSATRDHLAQIAAQLPEWPITYNELSDLSPFNALKIGYRDIPPKDPKARTGKTIFSQFASEVVKRMDFIRKTDTAKRLGQRWRDYRKWEALKAKYDAQYDWARGMSSDERLKNPLAAIHVCKVQCTPEIESLGEFEKANGDAWRRVGEEFFKEVFPQCHRIDSLAKEINDADVTLDSQIRAKIILRVGRAIAALAR